MLNKMLLVLVISRINIFILTGPTMIVFIHLSVKIDYFIFFIITILTHNYFIENPCSPLYYL